MEAAAFKATFSDFRLVKGRKQAQFVFEVPLEQADSALECLGGVPRSDNETWVGIAKLALNEEAEKKPEQKERRRFHEMSLSQQAGIRCADPEFQGWLDVANADRAAAEVRLRCKVASRAELNTNEEAANYWRDLDSCFLTETGRMAESR